MGEDVASIGEKAFYNCAYLSNINISKGIVKIGANAFEGCIALSNVAFENTEGWFVTEDADAISGINIEFNSENNNAIELIKNYISYCWKRIY